MKSTRLIQRRWCLAADVEEPFTFFCGVFEGLDIHHILKITAKPRLNRATQFQSTAVHGYKKPGSISLLSSNPHTTDSLFNSSYSGLIHTFTEAPFSQDSYQRAHLSTVSRRLRMGNADFFGHGNTTCSTPAHLVTGAQFLTFYF